MAAVHGINKALAEILPSKTKERKAARRQSMDKAAAPAVMDAARVEKAVAAPVMMDSASVEKAVAAGIEAAWVEKAAAAGLNAARPTAAEMEKAARMEKAAKLRAHRDDARRRREEYMRRRGLTSVPNSIFLVNETNSDTISNIDVDSLLGLNRQVDKKEILTLEKFVWSRAMEHLKSNDNDCHEYDLIPDNITLYPVVFESHTWYHCNLLGRRRDIAQASPTVFFVELKCKTSYDVMACIPLDGNTCNRCKVCATSCDIMHPLEGGFICGSKDGQRIFHYTIPDDRIEAVADEGTIATK